jgi:hypothetical protein
MGLCKDRKPGQASQSKNQDEEKPGQTELALKKKRRSKALRRGFLSVGSVYPASPGNLPHNPLKGQTK